MKMSCHLQIGVIFVRNISDSRPRFEAEATVISGKGLLLCSGADHTNFHTHIYPGFYRTYPYYTTNLKERLAKTHLTPLPHRPIRRQGAFSQVAFACGIGSLPSWALTDVQQLFFSHAIVIHGPLASHVTNLQAMTASLCTLAPRFVFPPELNSETCLV